MTDRKKLIVGAVAAALLILGVGTAVAAQQGTLPGQEDEPTATGALSASEEKEAEGSENEAGEGKDSGKSLTGSPAKQAAESALRATSGGTVLEVEGGDDPNAAYEVEVSKSGGVTEVVLDGDFNVIGQATGD